MFFRKESLITRNSQDFKKSSIPTVTPENFLKEKDLEDTVRWRK
jgi:hypothetical protein